ncbi:hypothetical protein MGA3_11695 [Bacillus methanolicus MGA3]|uniref:Putative membrane protein n=1 Tax=Bacillus methanolicus (strain MGA3 / ATCC 53907) TaxID=796606 RepID=I3E385_BACMM|nr:hypothetical protein [Bacillus methanolicus]AIE58955.1 putative membrane protein [Bacillus methanolicus MGA3]EIJ80956.1 hypothetical protein MGA3_11695 [Bacillus methanolicus MGA3]
MRGLHLLIQNELMKIYSKKRTWFFLVSLIIFVSIAVFINYKAEPNGNWKEKAASEIQMLKYERNGRALFLQRDYRKVGYWRQHFTKICS